MTMQPILVETRHMTVSTLTRSAERMEQKLLAAVDVLKRLMNTSFMVNDCGRE